MANQAGQIDRPAYSQARPTIRELGYTVLCEPVDKSHIVADLVFVHGLGGHPLDTWAKLTHDSSKSKGHGDLRPKKFKLDKKPKEPDQPESLCYWPFDLVRRDFPNLRVMRYGYDTGPTDCHGGRTSGTTISQYGTQLLGRVADARIECEARPLVFVAHSFGGILVKDALYESTK